MASRGLMEELRRWSGWRNRHHGKTHLVVSSSPSLLLLLSFRAGSRAASQGHVTGSPFCKAPLLPRRSAVSGFRGYSRRCN